MCRELCRIIEVHIHKCGELCRFICMLKSNALFTKQMNHQREKNCSKTVVPIYFLQASTSSITTTESTSPRSRKAVTLFHLNEHRADMLTMTIND